MRACTLRKSGPRAVERGMQGRALGVRAPRFVYGAVVVLAVWGVGMVPAAGASPVGAAQPKLGPCGAGELCLWQKQGFKAKRWVHELSDTDIDSCVPLPKGASAAALANRTGRPVTVYQSRECASTGEFHTHPSGTWTPRAAYAVRAFKIWEN